MSLCLHARNNAAQGRQRGSSVGQHDISTLNVTISVALKQQLDGISQCWDSIPETAHIWSYLSFVCGPIIHIKNNIDGAVSLPAIVHGVN